jgi:hypothetical protein
MATKTSTTADLIIEAMRAEERSQKWTAAHSGIALSTFRRKLFAGGGGFTVSEIARIARALRITPISLLSDSFESAALAA